MHETEGQLILNGSYNIDFTMDHEVKDLILFDELGKKHDVPLELSPLCVDIMRDGLKTLWPAYLVVDGGQTPRRRLWRRPARPRVSGISYRQ